MTTFRPDTSFPYLKIARECGVPYGDVIRFVENFGKGATMLVSYSPQWKHDAAEAMALEMERRWAQAGT